MDSYFFSRMRVIKALCSRRLGPLYATIQLFFCHKAPFGRQIRTNDRDVFRNEQFVFYCSSPSSPCHRTLINEHISIYGYLCGRFCEMTNMAERSVVPHPTGNILHWAFGYDLLVWLLSLGKEQTYRDNTLNLVRPKSGESVLDVGCGTGTLAIAAKRRVGPSGRVCGIDASPEMIRRARKKADKAAVEVTFENVFVQKLPFPDAAFDVVLSVTMLHHLSREARC